YQVNVSIINVPTSVHAGKAFNITFYARYFNGTAWLPLSSSQIRLTPIFDGLASTPIGPYMTNATGYVTFEIEIPKYATTMAINVSLISEYYHEDLSFQVSSIKVIPTATGVDLSFIIFILIIIGIALGSGGGSFAIYRGVIVPKKRARQRILDEVKTIFDDDINLEHVFILYKETGVCLFSKSFGSERIDPDLVSGFITAVSSFGKEMVAKETLNEIAYGDKMILIADGEYIRVALVLSKEPSIHMRENVTSFIELFENKYKDVLANWRGALSPFRDVGFLIDEIFDTSIILPHQITFQFNTAKDVKSTQARDILKISQSCVEDSGREFIFIATLLNRAIEETNMDIAEIFIGIKELREKKILVPIEISEIEVQPISQQELALLDKRISELTSISPEERSRLVQELARMGPVEREAYLSSLVEKHEIVSAPIKPKKEIGTFEDQKSAKKEIKRLVKNAKKLRAEKQYQNAIHDLQTAARIASNWKLKDLTRELEESIRKIEIEDLEEQKEDLKNKAKDALKKKDFVTAANYFETASKIASKIFKLGDASVMKEVKQLITKAKELRRKS
ncbi:MAG: hypothetical protein ACTSVX_09145, partial [Promethearchaeota archaeon]